VSASPAPRNLVGTKQSRLILTIAVLASFIAFLDGSIINVALPAIALDLGGGLPIQQWIVDAYLVTLCALILVAGSLSDIFGRVRVLRVGLFGFGAASVLCALAPSGEILVVARALQGIAGALLVPSSLALITASFRGKSQGQAIGRWSAWTSIAFIAGPVVGGLLVDSVGWRWVFGINVFPIIVTLLFLARLEEPAHTPAVRRIDYLGASLAIAGLGGPVFALVEQAHRGWGAPEVLIPLASGISSLVVFVWWQGRAAQPMVPLALFRIRNFGVGNLATAAIWGGVWLGVFIVPVFLQQVGAMTASEAGFATAPTAVIGLLVSSSVGKFVGRHGPRRFMIFGPVIAAVGFFWMASVTAPMNFWIEVLPGILLFGLGITATAVPVTTAVLSSISADQAGIGSALNNAIARVSGLVAIASVGVVTGGVLDYRGFQDVALVVGGLFLLGAAISAIGIRDPSLHEPAPSGIQ
jgi:EmrB/QacA subfamily drug resistance transporter